MKIGKGLVFGPTGPTLFWFIRVRAHKRNNFLNLVGQVGPMVADTSIPTQTGIRRRAKQGVVGTLWCN